jgi:hypothetical protein
MSESWTPPETPPYSGWASREDAERWWPDAEDMDADQLFSVLQAAYEQCSAYAPPLADGAAVPEGYLLAQVMQARAIARAGIAGRDDQVGPDGYTVTVFPMDWTVKHLLRPPRGRYQLR